jgi:predicted GTPase
VETIAAAWAMLDMFYDNPLAFVKDLMQEIGALGMIKEDDNECTMNYYVLLQSLIAEAEKAGLLRILLILANVKDMARPLPKWEARAWKEQQDRVQALDSATCFENFVENRLEYNTNLIANSKWLVLS